MKKQDKAGEKPKSEIKKLFKMPIFVGALIGLFVFIIFLLLMQFKALDVFELDTLTWRFKHFHSKTQASDRCVVLGVDNLSIGKLGQWPWTRSRYVKILKALKLYKAKTISFDLYFPYRNDHDLQGDIEFAETAKTLDNLVISMPLIQIKKTQLKESIGDIKNSLKRFSLEHTGSLPALGAEDAAKMFLTKEELKTQNSLFILLPSYKELLDSIDYMGALFLSSEDMSVISTPVIIDFQGDYYPFMPLATYLLTLKNKVVSYQDGNLILGDSKKIPLLKKGEYLINWYPPKKTSFPYDTYPIYYVVRAYEVLEKLSEKTGIPVEEVQKNIDTYYQYNCADKKTANMKKCTSEVYRVFGSFNHKEELHFETKDFKDKYVFIGIIDSTIGIKDNIKTPLMNVVPGVYLHANVLDNILQNDFIKKVPDSTTILVLLILTVLTGVTFLGIKSPGISIGTSLLYCLYFLLPLFAFRHCNYWMDLIYTESAIVVTFMFSLAYQLIIVDKDKRQVSKTFSNYLAPQVLTEIMSDPSKVRLGGKRKDVSVLFSDIRGFTSISEVTEPEEVVVFLNEFFDAMVEAIMKHEGTIDKFIGDAIMAFWGAPIEHENHAELAVRGALEMAEALKDLKRKWVLEGRNYPEINVGIGINTGDAIVGNVGSSKIKSYTLIGDAVNLASRLEGLNKRYADFGDPERAVIISEFTYNHVKDIFDVEYLGEEKVKGKDIAVKIYKVLGIKEA